MFHELGKGDGGKDESSKMIDDYQEKRERKVSREPYGSTREQQSRVGISSKLLLLLLRT